jgi:hypothetical protein
MKHIFKIFFVYLFLNVPILTACGQYGLNNNADTQRISLEKRYQQARLEYQTTIICMLVLLESNKHLLLQVLERSEDLFDEEITLQNLRETEWKMDVLRTRLAAS